MLKCEDNISSITNDTYLCIKNSRTSAIFWSCLYRRTGGIGTGGTGWCWIWRGSQIFLAICHPGNMEKWKSNTKMLMLSTIPGKWYKSWCNHWKLLSPTFVSKRKCFWGPCASSWSSTGGAIWSDDTMSACQLGEKKPPNLIKLWVGSALSPIIMVQWQIILKWKETKTNIGDTPIFHFHGYGRKGSRSFFFVGVLCGPKLSLLLRSFPHIFVSRYIVLYRRNHPASRFRCHDRSILDPDKCLKHSLGFWRLPMSRV